MLIGLLLVQSSDFLNPRKPNNSDDVVKGASIGNVPDYRNYLGVSNYTEEVNNLCGNYGCDVFLAECADDIQNGFYDDLLCHKEDNEYCYPEIYYEEESTEKMFPFDCSNKCHRYYGNYYAKQRLYESVRNSKGLVLWNSTDVLACKGYSTCSTKGFEYGTCFQLSPYNTSFTNKAEYDLANINQCAFCNPEQTSLLNACSSRDLDVIKTFDMQEDVILLGQFLYMFECYSLNGQACYSELITYDFNIAPFTCGNVCQKYFFEQGIQENRNLFDLFLPGSSEANFVENGWKLENYNACYPPTASQTYNVTLNSTNPLNATSSKLLGFEIADTSTVGRTIFGSSSLKSITDNAAVANSAAAVTTSGLPSPTIQPPTTASYVSSSNLIAQQSAAKTHSAILTAYNRVTETSVNIIPVVQQTSTSLIRIVVATSPAIIGQNTVGLSMVGNPTSKGASITSTRRVSSVTLTKFVYESTSKSEQQNMPSNTKLNIAKTTATQNSRGHGQLPFAAILILLNLV